MSWYNDEQQNSFIDATQEFTGGGGGGSSLTIINEPTITDTPEGGVPTISVPELNIGFETTLNDLINIRQDGNANFQVYINNANDNGEIRFYTKNAMNINDYNYSYLTFSYSEPRLTYNTKINKDGILQYYHSYHIAYPQKFSGWYSVDYDISALETAQNVIGVGLATAQGEITLLTTDLGLLNTDYFAFKTKTTVNIIDLYNLVHGLYTSERGLVGWRGDGETINTFDRMWNNLGGVIDRSTNLGGVAELPEMLVLQGSRLAYLTTFVNRFQTAVTYGTIGAGIYGIYYLIDKQTQDNANEDLLTFQRLRLDIEDNVANGDTSSQVVEHIFIDYLTIDATTNNGFTTAGVYEYVDIGNDATLAIKIKDNGSGTLIAEIISIMEMGSGFSVNDEIFIDKSDIGGSTGQLKITVTQLASYAYILEQEEIKASDRLNEVNNRIRRRDNIPNTSSFSSDGFTITNTQISEPSGETTNEPTISLKVDTSQFSYDGSGNLQLTGFTNIGNTGNLGIPSDTTQNPPIVATGLNLQVETNTGNIETIQTNLGIPSDATQNPPIVATGLNLQVETNTGNIETLQTNLGVASSIIPLVSATGLNADVETLREEVGDNTSIPKTGIHKSIDDIFNLLGTIPDYDADGNVVDLATGIYARIDNIYKVVMEEGYTFDNNTDYKLSLGYDTVWNGFHYNLFCVALKTIRSGDFSSSFYNNDFMGLFPSLERLIDKPTEYVLVKDVGIILLTNFHIGEGLLYFNNVNPTINYDLARKFELVIFLTPKNIDNLNVEYTILQTGIKIGSEYEIDNNKLKLSIINNKLNITNYIYYNEYYYQSLTTSLFNTYMLSTFSTTGSFNQNTNTGLKEAINTVSGRTHYIGIKSVQISPTTVPTDQVWYDIVRSAGGQTSSFYYWNFDILRDMTYQPQTWKSPVFYYKEDLPLPANRNNFSKIKIRYDMENFTTGVGWSSASFGSQNAIDTGLEFKMKITRKQYDEPFNSYGSILVEFNQTTKVAGEVWYEMDIWIDNNSPIASSTKYNWVELELVHKGGSFTPLPSGIQSYTYYNSQHRIKVYTFSVFEYDTIPTNIPNWKLHTFQDDINDFFPTPIQQITPHKAVFNLDLQNKLINYYVDDIGKALTLPSEITITGTAFPNEDPNQSIHPATFEFANNTFTTLNQNNNILIIGNEPSVGELNYSHFNWKFIPNGGNEDFMTLSQRNKLDELIKYNYYYETVSVPRYLKTKELYADVFDARRILINGGALYDDLTPADQVLSLKSADQSSDDVAITNAFVPIDKLFVRNPTQDGFLNYNFANKEFSISSLTISSADVESAVVSLLNNGISGGMKITSGDVGIGTTAPEALLHLKGGDTSTGAVQLKIENASYNKGIVFNYASASSSPYDFVQAKIYTTGSSYNTDLHFATADGSSSYKIDDSYPYHTLNTNMTIRYNGNVGIGTENPTHKLDVNGDINISDGSSFKINGVAIPTTQYTNSDVETYLGTIVDTGLSFVDDDYGNKKLKSTITQYTDADVEAVLSVSAGNGLTWNNLTKKFDSSGGGGDLSAITVEENSVIKLDYEVIKKPNLITETIITDNRLTQEPIVVSNDLIVHYKFDDNLENSAPVGSIGALVETNTPAQFKATSGDFKFGKSALVNNTTLTIPNFHFSSLTESSTKSFTISFWYKANSLSGTWNILFDASNYTSFEAGIRVYINTNNYLYIYYYNSGSSNDYTLALNGDFPDNNWRLYTFVWEYQSHSGNIYTYDLRFYEDGVINGGVDRQVIKSDNQNGFQIGDGNPDGLYQMEGYYDDFRIYNRVLSQDEITNLYNNNILYELEVIADTNYKTILLQGTSSDAGTFKITYPQETVIQVQDSSGSNGYTMLEGSTEDYEMGSQIIYYMGQLTTNTQQVVPSGYLKYDTTANNYQGGWEVVKENETLREQLDLFYWDNGHIIIDIQYSFDNTNWYDVSQGDTISFVYIPPTAVIQPEGTTKIHFRLKRCSITNVYNNHYEYTYETFFRDFNPWDGSFVNNILNYTISRRNPDSSAESPHLEIMEKTTTLNQQIQHKNHAPVYLGFMDFTNTPDDTYRFFAYMSLLYDDNYNNDLLKLPNYLTSGFGSYTRMFYINKTTGSAGGGTY